MCLLVVTLWKVVLLIFFYYYNFIGLNLSKQKGIRCKQDLKSHAVHLPNESVKVTLKKETFKQCLWNFCCQWQPKLRARPYEQGLWGSKTFANSSLYNFSYSVLY